MKTPPRSVGFSLVEVTLALGLVAFCLIALIALLPAGLDSVQDSADEAAAVNCLEQITKSIRGAVSQTNSPGGYRAAGVYSNSLGWTLGGQRVEATIDRLAPGGFPDAGTSGPFYKARVELTPPPSQTGTGTALVSVAWPEQAQWDDARKDWVNAQGRVNTWMVFRAAP